MAGFLARITGGLLRNRTLQAGSGITISNPAGDAGDPVIAAVNAGTVTHTGTLTANQLVLGNGGADITSLGSAGTSTTVLHGGSPPTFSAVALAADVSGTLADAHLTANVALDNLNNFMVAQTFASGCVVDANTPAFYMHDQAAAANQKYWRFEQLGDGLMRIEPLNDAFVVLATFLLDRSANIQSFGGQIGFPATQNASSGANVLDDYEEGTWTPTDASGAGLTFSSANGFYIKIGRKVFITGTVVYPATGAANVAKWGGLPFTVQTSQPGGGGCPTFTNYNVDYCVFCRENTTTIELFSFAGASLVVSTFGTTSNIFQATYMASA